MIKYTPRELYEKGILTAEDLADREGRGDEYRMQMAQESLEDLTFVDKDYLVIRFPKNNPVCKPTWSEEEKSFRHMYKLGLLRITSQGYALTKIGEVVKELVR